MVVAGGVGGGIGWRGVKECVANVGIGKVYGAGARFGEDSFTCEMSSWEAVRGLFPEGGMDLADLAVARVG